MTFQARIERLDDGMRFHVVPIPVDIATELLAAGHKRVVLALNGAELKRAIQGNIDDGHFLMFGKGPLKELALREGSAVEVEIWSDPNPDEVEVAEEFLAVLDEDAEAKKIWDEMTTGMRRSLAIYLNGAKRSETRSRRSLDVAEKMRTGTLYSQRKKSK